MRERHDARSRGFKALQDEIHKSEMRLLLLLFFPEIEGTEYAKQRTRFENLEDEVEEELASLRSSPYKSGNLVADLGVAVHLS
jgi:hypothetical protein